MDLFKYLLAFSESVLFYVPEMSIKSLMSFSNELNFICCDNSLMKELNYLYPVGRALAGKDSWKVCT